MRAVLQRVSQASVTVDGQVIGEIGKGVMVLFGMLGTDDDKTIEYMPVSYTHLDVYKRQFADIPCESAVIKNPFCLYTKGVFLCQNILRL